MWPTLAQALLHGIGVTVLVYLCAALIGPLRIRKCDKWALSLGGLSTLMFLVHGLSAA